MFLNQGIPHQVENQILKHLICNHLFTLLQPQQYLIGCCLTIVISISLESIGPNHLRYTFDRNLFVVFWFNFNWPIFNYWEEVVISQVEVQVFFQILYHLILTINVKWINFYHIVQRQGHILGIQIYHVAPQHHHQALLKKYFIHW